MMGDFVSSNVHDYWKGMTIKEIATLRAKEYGFPEDESDDLESWIESLIREFAPIMREGELKFTRDYIKKLKDEIAILKNRIENGA